MNRFGIFGMADKVSIMELLKVPSPLESLFITALIRTFEVIRQSPFKESVAVLLGSIWLLLCSQTGEKLPLLYSFLNLDAEIRVFIIGGSFGWSRTMNLESLCGHVETVFANCHTSDSEFYCFIALERQSFPLLFFYGRRPML